MTAVTSAVATPIVITIEDRITHGSARTVAARHNGLGAGLEPSEFIPQSIASSFNLFNEPNTQCLTTVVRDRREAFRAGGAIPRCP